MPRYTPQIGVRGLYELRAPFDTRLHAGVQYQCVAIRRLTDLIANDEDPFPTYYEPMGLDNVVYEQDLTDGVCLISLQSDLGDIAYIPDSYIVGFPEINGVTYRTLALAVNIGAIPDSLDLSYVQTKVRDDVMEILGVADAQVSIVNMSHPTVIAHADHVAIEAARQDRIGSDQTDHALYLESQRQLVIAQEKVAELEAFIISLNL